MKSESGRLASLNIGVRLAEARRQRGLTLAQLGKKAGVAVSTVASIENQEKQPRSDTVEKLARALAVPRSWLCFGDGLPPEWE
jgi:transcriptional regulator with XRE-family HTH domain